MSQPLHVYKRYSNQIRHNTVILFRQQQLFNSHQRQEQKIQTFGNPDQIDGTIKFKASQQRNLGPLVFKKFQEYFNKNTQPNKNMKIFNKIIQTTSNIQSHTPSRCLPMTSRELAKVFSKDKKMTQKNYRNNIKSDLGTSESKIEKAILTGSKEKIKCMFQESNITKNEYNLNNLTGPISSKNRKRQKLNNSIDLGKLLNKTVSQNYQETISNQLNLLNLRQENAEAQSPGYLKIDRSILVERKYLSTKPCVDQDKRLQKEEQVKQAIRTKIKNRKRVLEQSYMQKLRSRSPSPVKYPKKINYLDYLNPLGRQQLSLLDLFRISTNNSMVDEVRLNMNGCFFSVYVQQGNNSQLIKSAVRSIGGWRVAELPSVANLVWTQNYRNNLSQKKPKKIVREQILQNQNQTSRSRQRLSSKDKYTQSFLVSGRLERKSSGFSEYLRRKSSQQIPSPASRTNIPLISDNNYPELRLNRSINPDYQSYQNDVKKLLPIHFQLGSFKIKSQKQLKKLVITPNFLIHNHLIGHRAISDKKNLLLNLRKYYYSKGINPFNYIPESHDIRSLEDNFIGKQNESYQKSNESQKMKKQVWIIKPGEDSNRGQGITICKGWQQTVRELGKRVKLKCIANILSPQDKTSPRVQQISSQTPDNLVKKANQGKRYDRSVILQRYIIPLLYNGRKFDIRSYMLVTWANKVFNGYFYEECYIRTSSKQFDLDSQNKYVHLTNDAIQCMSHQYGKYEEGNKVSEAVFQKYFNQQFKNKKNSWNQIKEQMAIRSKDILKCSSKKLVGRFGSKQSPVKQAFGYNMDSCISRRPEQMTEGQRTQKVVSLFSSNHSAEKQTQMSFQLFGLDFMIDQESLLWLIQVNTNPAITHHCSRVLNKLIPKLIHNTLAISVMPYMRPSRISQTNKYHNQFSHIYQQEIKDQ